MIDVTKFEFDLNVRVYGPKDRDGYYSPSQEPEQELKEELSYKSLSAVDVMRKLLDYIR